jgi:hypothetical protein
VEETGQVTHLRAAGPIPLILRGLLLSTALAVACIASAQETGASSAAGGDVAPGLTTADSTAVAAAPVCNVMASDVADDGGGAITVKWTTPEPAPGAPDVQAYDILRYTAGSSPEEVGVALPTETSYTDDTAEDGVAYQYIVRTQTSAGSVDSEPSGPAFSSAQWFSVGRLNVFIVTVLFTVAVFYFLYRAKRGAELYIRKIPGLEAVDDAVGRATEMGRPVLYVPGIETVSEVGTLAALIILGHVAKRVAQHGTPLEVPCADPIVMTTAQEIVKTAYTEVGQIDNYDPSKVAYLTYDQFGYTAGVDGIMVRERPEAVFLLGTFYAESLILAETGHAIGAIQIAGTKETSQLPFFVAACDYTLIGEELFAASSYLSREPVQLGSLKGQDLAKMWIVYFIIAGFVIGTIGALLSRNETNVFNRAFDIMKTLVG